MSVSLDLFLEKIHISWRKKAEPLMDKLGPIQWLEDGELEVEVNVEPFPSVWMLIEGKNLLDFSCTCDQSGPICEHVLATCLVLQQTK